MTQLKGGIASRDPRAYRAKKARESGEEARARKTEAIERRQDETHCYTQHNPPQIRFAFEMIQTCMKPA